MLNEAPLKSTISLLIYAASAKPTPKLGQALGPLGINMMYFCKVCLFLKRIIIL